MYQLLDSDTICAISTPAGVGGIAVIRVSGPDAVTIVDSIWKGRRLADVSSHTAHLGDIVDPENPSEPLDTAVATVFRNPRSFTGEDVVEIAVHGSRWIQRELVNLLIRRGCRMAEPGEFTRRAFSNGRLDLAQAEAVADVIAASSRSAHRLASSQMRGEFSKHIAELRDKLIEIASLLELELDFSEEDVEFASRQQLRELADSLLTKISGLASSFSTGSALKDGVPVAIVGEPNAGKSTLLNALLQDNRAIVSDIPGTTRDTIEDTMEIDGVLYRFIDTAGIRETSDSIENLGIERSYAAIARARIVIWLITPDLSPTDYTTLHALITSHLPEDTALITVLNKIDTLPTTTPTSTPTSTPSTTPIHASITQQTTPIATQQQGQNTPEAANQQNSTIISNQKETPETGNQKETSEAGSQKETTEAGSQKEAPETGSQKEAPETGNQKEASEIGSQKEAYETGSQKEAPETGNQKEASEIGSQKEASETGSQKEASEIGGPKGSYEICGQIRTSVATKRHEDAIIRISATNGTNLPALIKTLRSHSGAETTQEADLIVTNARHYEALTHAASSLQRVISGIDTNISGDFIAQDLRETIHHLSSITGTITTTDLLQTIFQKFCIGK